jgi:hypothetical protein
MEHLAGSLICFRRVTNQRQQITADPAFTGPQLLCNESRPSPVNCADIVHLNGGQSDAGGLPYPGECGRTNTAGSNLAVMQLFLTEGNGPL